jgi:hypothetical protein
MDFDTALARIKVLNFNWAFDISKSGELTFFSETGRIFSDFKLRKTNTYTLTKGTILTECHLRENNGSLETQQFRQLFTCLISRMNAHAGATAEEKGQVQRFREQAELQYRKWVEVDPPSVQGLAPSPRLFQAQQRW